MTSCMRKCMKVSESTEDAISNLPNEIIDHILDYMPLRDAARTSILSRKWRNFWPMHSKLIFDEHCFRVIRSGMLVRPDSRVDKIINKILLQHVGPVVEFFLDLSYVHSPQYSDVDQWMSFLSRNGVRELTLLHSKFTGVPYLLPSCVFSCTSLEHLTLHGVVIRPHSCISLGNLISLSFKSVTCVPNFPSGYSCSLSTPQLKKLSIESCIGFNKLGIVAPLLEIYMISSSPLISSLLTQNLKAFKFSLGHEVQKPRHLILSPFVKLSTIRVLVFDGFFLKLLAIGQTQIEPPGPEMCVEHLTLDDLNFTDFAQISTAVYLLQSSPNLRVLDLNVSSRIKINKGDGGVLNYLNTPKCMKKNFVKLRVVRINRFQYPVAELLMLIRLLLAQSPSLDKILIESKCSIDPAVGFRITRKLLEFARASPSARILWNHL